MIELLKSLIVGGVVGGLFAILKLPIPAPNQLQGIMGILGLFLGYKGVLFLVKLVDIKH